VLDALKFAASSGRDSLAVQCPSEASIPVILEVLQNVHGVVLALYVAGRKTRVLQALDQSVVSQVSVHPLSEVLLPFNGFTKMRRVILQCLRYFEKIVEKIPPVLAPGVLVRPYAYII